LAEDIAGGLMVTMPSEKDFKSDLPVGKNGETISEVCTKYFKGSPAATTEERMRVLRFIENVALGTAAVGYRTESLHGAGSPQAQRIMIARQSNIESKKELAKVITGIKK
jgi:4-hydroxybutyryl-CoA dehydratase/vinylacetyl-CoA-Delta-isomerase